MVIVRTDGYEETYTALSIFVRITFVHYNFLTCWQGGAAPCTWKRIAEAAIIKSCPSGFAVLHCSMKFSHTNRAWADDQCFIFRAISQDSHFFCLFVRFSLLDSPSPTLVWFVVVPSKNCQEYSKTSDINWIKGYNGWNVAGFKLKTQ